MINKESEGYIKFSCKQVSGDFEFSDNDFNVLEEWRSIFYQLNWIGAYPDGIGFGNISIRYYDSGNFIITGSATGNFKTLGKHQYALVTEYDFKLNTLNCSGKFKASSESLSHAIIYDTNPDSRAVIHIHNKLLWERNKFVLPTTNELVPYGTPEMADDIKRIIRANNLKNNGIIIMGGHEEGIISFGRNLEEAGNIILEEWQKIRD